jgi:hypothetical protein
MRPCLVWISLALWAASLQARAAERRFDFSKAPTNAPPPGCTSTLSGEGKPGDWRVFLTEGPPELNALPGSLGGLKTVVGQLARDTTDNHFPMLVLGNERYDDFTLTTRFKIVGGDKEQMAGMAFRMQDENNFFVARVNALTQTFYFYKFEKGQRSPPVGNNVKFQADAWHDLSVKCQGTEIDLALDGVALPALNDPTFSAGRIAFWTKSDSVVYFTDTRITYVEKVPFAQRMVDDMLKEYPRLLGLQVYVPGREPSETRMIASADGKGIGEAGEAADADVIKRGVQYYRKNSEMAVVTMPLTDRNGDPVAAVRVMLKPLPGQTEENARVRALPVVKEMQQRMAAVKSLTNE